MTETTVDTHEGPGVVGDQCTMIEITEGVRHWKVYVWSSGSRIVHYWDNRNTCREIFEAWSKPIGGLAFSTIPLVDDVVT